MWVGEKYLHGAEGCEIVVYENLAKLVHQKMNIAHGYRLGSRLSHISVNL